MIRHIIFRGGGAVDEGLRNGEVDSQNSIFNNLGYSGEPTVLTLKLYVKSSIKTQ